MSLVFAADPANPNQDAMYGLPYKWCMKSVTLTDDNNNPQTFTAADVGLNMVLGAIVVAHAAPANGATAHPLVVSIDDNLQGGTIRAYTSDSVADGPLKQVPTTGNVDLSTFTARVLFFGH